MSCPECGSEVAYAPLLYQLVCVAEHCSWSLQLIEDDALEFLFPPKKHQPVSM